MRQVHASGPARARHYYSGETVSYETVSLAVASHDKSEGETRDQTRYSPEIRC